MRVTLDLTPTEASALSFAAELTKDDVDESGGGCMGWTGAEVAAYRRALRKLDAELARVGKRKGGPE